MMDITECIQDNTSLYIVGDDTHKRRRFFKKKEPKIYRKHFNHAEFIGEELCGIRNLRCVHYFLIGEGSFHLNSYMNYGDIQDKCYAIKLGSYDFKNPDSEYFYIRDYSKSSNVNYLDVLLSYTSSDKNYCELLDEVEEMFALDTYMGQMDRFSTNILFELDSKDEIHLSPLFDFEYSLKSSYLDSHCIYGNTLFHFRTLDDYYEFLNAHPEFYDKLKSYLDVNLDDVVRRCYQVRGLVVPKDKYYYYQEFDENQKKLIKKILQ